MSDAKVKQKPNIIFFFGAGASVDADIPNTYQFVDDFKSMLEEATEDTVYVEEADRMQLLIKILETREKFNKRVFGAGKEQVDVEQLLDTLNRLEHSDKDVLLYFYNQNAFDHFGNYAKQQVKYLKEQLEDFIREKVIVKDERKLEYLKDLLNFEFPLEIYSVNYDTCVEQLANMKRLRYTDGFNTYWDKKNFDGDFDIKHYKMHGSVIWYENERTKEYVKIPILKQTNIRLVSGESVKPLLIYPAQKMEYIEPLTELQLMFKERLMSKETKILIVVGYSFRDDYLIHVLWDAARKNENLYVVLVNPEAQSILKEKLEFVEKEDEKSKSSIHDRVICLPYPFSTVIYRLKNHYLDKLSRFSEEEKTAIESEKKEIPIEWERLLRFCIDCEFLTRAENILKEKIGRRWIEIPFDQPQTRALYAIKAMLHSVIAKDGFENEWLVRVNESINFFSTENLLVSDPDESGFQLRFKLSSDVTPSFKTTIDQWVQPILNERNDKLKLLTNRFDWKLLATEESFKTLEGFRDYLSQLQGGIGWEEYFRLRNGHGELDRMKEFLQNRSTQERFEKLKELVLEIERKELAKIFGGTTFQFQFQDEQKAKCT